MAVLSDGGRRTAEAIVARYPAGRERSAVLPLLYLMQSVEGRLTRDGLREVGELLGITTAEVEAVASFYTMLRLRPTGTHVVSVCTNLPCALRGANDVFEAAHDAAGIEHGEETSPDGVFTVHEEECLGACDAAPVIQVDVANHDRVTPARVVELVEALRAGEVPTPSRGRAPRDFREASRILAGGSGGSRSERVSASGSPPRAGAEETA
jgi:NADH-quinone oxidoreductase subunit E